MRAINLFPLFGFYTAVHAQDCYFPNGTLSTTADVVPCANDPVRTTCCATNRSVPSGGDAGFGLTADVCLDSGMCFSNRTDGGNIVTEYWLSLCTNSDFSSPDCINECRTTRNSVGTTRVTPCEKTSTNTRWCCGISASCCTSGVGVVELPVRFGQKGVTSSTITNVAQSSTSTSSGMSSVTSSSLSSSSSSSSSSPSSATSTPPPPPPKSTGLSTGAIAGIVAVTIFNVLLFLGVIFFLRKSMAWKKQATLGQQQHGSQQAIMHEVSGMGVNEMGDGGTHPSELHGVSQAHELPMDRRKL